LQAQNFKISGKVSDKGDHSVLIGASVILKTMPDSSDVAVITSDVNGQFTFSGLKAGPYLVVSSYVGYKTFKKAIEIGFNPVFNMPIELDPDDITLKGVEIVGRTPQ
jgi:hypothetical protein